MFCIPKTLKAAEKLLNVPNKYQDLVFYRYLVYTSGSKKQTWHSRQTTHFISRRFFFFVKPIHCKNISLCQMRSIFKYSIKCIIFSVQNHSHRDKGNNNVQAYTSGSLLLLWSLSMFPRNTIVNQQEDGPSLKVDIFFFWSKCTPMYETHEPSRRPESTNIYNYEVQKPMLQLF